jgi:hypothetical protein
MSGAIVVMVFGIMFTLLAITLLVLTYVGLVSITRGLSLVESTVSSRRRARSLWVPSSSSDVDLSG